MIWPGWTRTMLRALEVRHAVAADADRLLELARIRAQRFGVRDFDAAYFGGRLGYALLAPTERLLVVTWRGRIRGVVHAVLGEVAHNGRPRIYVPHAAFAGVGWLGLPAAIRRLRRWGRAVGAPTVVVTSCGLSSPWAYALVWLSGLRAAGIFYEGAS